MLSDDDVSYWNEVFINTKFWRIDNMKRYGYHAGDIKDNYISEPLNRGLHSTGQFSGFYYVTDPLKVEYHGAGLNGEHKQNIYKVDLKGLNLLPLTSNEYKIFGKYNQAMYYLPIWIEYNNIAYQDLDDAFDLCFSSFYCDEIPLEEKAKKFVNELYDSYKIEVNDISKIDGEYYSFKDYINDFRTLKHLKAVLNNLPEDLHNVLPAWDLLLNGEKLIEKKLMEYHLYKNQHWYYHASDKPIEKLVNNGKPFWIASDESYIDNYIAVNTGKRKYKYIVGLKNDLTIFDPREQYDREQFFDWAAGYDFDDVKGDLIVEDSLEDYGIDSWDAYAEALSYADWNLMESPFVQKYVKDITYDPSIVYDGFVSIKDGYVNYGIYNVEQLKIGLDSNFELEENKNNFNKQDLIDQLDNYLNKREITKKITSIFDKIANIVNNKTEDDIVDFSIEIYKKYENLYDINTGRFNNFKAPMNDNFATQLLLKCSYEGIYPFDGLADSSVYGGCIFHFNKNMLVN